MLFLLQGEDTFRSKEKLNQLIEGFLEKNPYSKIDVFDFSEKKYELGNVLEAFGSGGLFSSKKMLVLENIMKELLAEDQKTILAILKKNTSLKEDRDLMVIFREDGNPKKNSQLFKYLQSHSKTQLFELLDSRGLEKWATEYIKKVNPNVSFSGASISMLVSYVGNDLFLLKNELEKLSNYKLSGEIVDEDVDLLVNSQTHSTVFLATEAFLGGNKKHALKLLHEQIKSGEDLFYLLSMYSYQTRILLKIASSLESGNSIPAQIAKETGLHPYVVQKSISRARLTGVEKLKIVFAGLQKIDLGAKTGKIDLQLALDRFITET